MHISFDSIDEIDAFVARWSRPDEMHVTIDLPDPEIDWKSFAANGGFPPGGVAIEGEPETRAVETSVGNPFHAEPKAGRKRRTKAEIAADELAAQQAQLQQIPAASAQEAQPAAYERQERTNPFATESAAPAAAIQAILDAPNQQAASLAGMAAVSMNALPEEPAVATVAAAVKPTDPEIIQSWIKDTAVGNIGPLDLMTHMTRAKAFIAKHGTAKYNESYALAGLPPNIMEYADEQRSLHAAALEFIDWDGK